MLFVASNVPALHRHAYCLHMAYQRRFIHNKIISTKTHIFVFTISLSPVNDMFEARVYSSSSAVSTIHYKRMGINVLNKDSQEITRLRYISNQ